MGLASYLMFLLPMAYAVAFDMMGFGWRGLAASFLFAIAVNAAFFALIRSGLSRRFADPSMTFAQIAAGPVSLGSIIAAVSTVSFGSLYMHCSCVYGVSGGASIGISLSEKSRISEQPVVSVIAARHRGSEHSRTMTLTVCAAYRERQEI